MSIPVFHDDQHGTAIISGAALLNALELVGKHIEQVQLVVNGAGAAGIACAEHYVRLGVKRENIILCDTKGVIYEGRKEGMNPYKARFAAKTDKRTLAEAMEGADVFPVSPAPTLSRQDMIRSMADQPIIFAMANPDAGNQLPGSESSPGGRHHGHGPVRLSQPGQQCPRLSLYFPRRPGCASPTINEEMKLAATRALAALAKEDVPDSVLRAYGVRPPALRAGLHHSQAIRPARPGVGSFRRRSGGDGERSGAGEG